MTTHECPSFVGKVISDDAGSSARERRGWTDPHRPPQSWRSVGRMRGQFGGEVVRPAVVAAGDLHRCAVRWDLGVWSVGFASLNPRLLTGIALRCVVGLGQLHVIGALKGLCRLPAGESEGELVD